MRNVHEAHIALVVTLENPLTYEPTDYVPVIAPGLRELRVEGSHITVNEFDWVYGRFFAVNRVVALSKELGVGHDAARAAGQDELTSLFQTCAARMAYGDDLPGPQGLA